MFRLVAQMLRMRARDGDDTMDAALLARFEFEQENPELFEEEEDDDYDYDDDDNWGGEDYDDDEEEDYNNEYERLMDRFVW